MKAETAKMSNILLKEKTSQALSLVKNNPYEAMTKATALVHKYPKDERAIALCLRIALKAKVESGKDMMTEAVFLMGQSAYELVWMSPILSALHVVSKALMDKPIEKEDIVAMKRAVKMGPEVTSEVLKDAKKALGSDHELFTSLS